MWIEINFVFCRGIEIGLILEWGSNWLDFSSGADINLIFEWGIEFWVGFMVGIGGDLFFVREIEIDRVRAEINLC